MNPNPFAVLGLPERPDLNDETVRAAWRALAADTHPDRADGGDLDRYTQASAAYADLGEQARREGRFDADDDEPGTAPLPAVPAAASLRLHPVPPSQLVLALVWLPSRVRCGRPLRLLTRAAIAAGLWRCWP